MLLDLQQDKLDLDTWRQFYRLAISFVQPRPIAWVSSLDADGVANLAPYSFFNMVSANPPVLMFAPTIRRDSTHKDTLNNARHSKEFVVNIVTESVAEAMNQSSGDYPPDVDEFEATGMTKQPATLIRTPMVAESPVNIECRLHDIYSFGDHPGAGQMVLGRVLRVHIDDSIMDGELIDQSLLKNIGRMGGSSYCKTSGAFDLHRPKV